MSTEKSEELKGLAEYIGFSAPEIPKYLILNNFLSCFFNNRKADYLPYCFDDFKDIITCEESDEVQLEKLKRSFDEYFSQYTGKSIMAKAKRSNGTKSFYLPINKNMIIIDESSPLRNLPYRLIKKSKYGHELEEDLTKYLYSDSFGTNQIISFLCSNLKKKEDNKKISQNETEEETMSYFNNLAKNMGEDLKIILTNNNFIQLDYYRKIEYLSTLLTIYTVLYIIKRPSRGEKNKSVIICKGSVNTNNNSNEFHRACLVNYVKIKEGFNVLFKDYFTKCLVGIDQITITHFEEGKIIIKENKGKEVTLSEFIKKLQLGTPKESINSSKILLAAFSIKNPGDIKDYSKNDFILRYINFLKNSGGSSFTKTSSTLPTLGREAGLIFPLSRTRFKYFALSEDLAEFFVRLYLSSQEGEREYDYLESFVKWIEKRYGICILKSRKLEEYLKSINAKISGKDFNENEEAFIQNLINVNCLIKMSDNGYVITLPEKKGEFKLL